MRCFRCSVWPCACQDGQAIIHGDCREVVAELEGVHCVVTSPPYNTLPTRHAPSGLHAERKSGVNRWIDKATKGYSDTMPEDEYQRWLCDILGACFEKTIGLMWVNHKIRYRQGVAIHPARMFPWPIYSEVIWDRRGSLALNCKRYAPSTEHLLAFGKPHVWNDELNTLMSVWAVGFARRKHDHPCPFPVEIAKRPIQSSTNPGDVVLDPFLGSGTTLIAAAELGRRGIGIELEERFCELAARRLEQEVVAA